MEYISKLFLNDNNLLLHNETINEMYELTQENISNYASFSPTFFFFLYNVCLGDIWLKHKGFMCTKESLF